MTSNERQIWTPERSGSAVRRPQSSSSDDGHVDWPDALGRGLRARCPVCGQGRLFAGYLSVVDRCPVCGTPLASVPADDAPPWVTILIALHVLIGLVVLISVFLIFR